jgi:DNA-3-methyladenine glycosylase II
LVDTRKALRHLRRVEPRFAALIGAHGPPGYARTRNSFRSLTRAIIYQQISGSAAAAIFASFVALFDDRGFPTPAAVAELEVDELREAGLSRQKATYIREVAVAYVDGRIAPRRFNRMSDDEIAEMLTAIKGLGRWSADISLVLAR